MTEDDIKAVLRDLADAIRALIQETAKLAQQIKLLTAERQSGKAE